MAEQKPNSPDACAVPEAISRRSFLLQAEGATVTVMLTGIPGVPRGVEIPAWVAACSCRQNL